MRTHPDIGLMTARQPVLVSGCVEKGQEKEPPPLPRRIPFTVNDCSKSLTLLAMSLL